MRSISTRTIRWLLVAAPLAAGCQTGPDRAETARIRVTGTSPGTLQLILSNQFSAVPDLNTGQFVTVFAAADTFDLSLPIDRSYPLGAAQRIFVRLSQPDSTREADVTMRIHLDDREVYQQRSILRGTFLEYQFTYQ
jgi:hypothetical protein